MSLTGSRGSWLPVEIKAYLQIPVLPQGSGDRLGETGVMVLGMATIDSIPAVITVNTALRISFFTVVLLSSLGIPWGILSIVWLVDRGPR
jgi:hypothetical protein